MTRTKKYLLLFNETFGDFKKLILKLTDSLLLLMSLLGVICMIYFFGFDIQAYIKANLEIFFQFLASIFLVLLTIQLFLKRKRKIQAILFDFLLISLLGLMVLEKYTFPEWFKENLSILSFLQKNVVIYLITIVIFIIEVSKRSLFIFLSKINPAVLFIISFMFIIITGTGLLLLPNATTNGISFIDSLFTSTSAVCVTGLASVDTQYAFTALGKGIILMLIQLGGLGVMTFTSFFGLFFSGNDSFRNNMFIKDMINNDTLADIFKNLLKILVFTLVIELAGAIIIYFNIDRTFFPDEAANLRYSIFHSISAFCNAGFSTLSQGLYDIRFRFNYPVHLTVAFLIILGGIGFPILLNYYKLAKHYLHNFFRKLKSKSYLHKPNIININTRIVIYTTLILLFFGTVAFFFTEYNNTLKEHSLGGKIVEAFFLSVTPRTAGFNTVDYGAILPSTILLTIFLMWVGASPGSTGGGIKTSSFAIAILNVFSIAKGKNRIEVSRKEIADDSVRKAFATILLSLLAIGVSILLVSSFEKGEKTLAIAFECFSAFGTVGLSNNLTPTLSPESKWVLVFTMFLGRVGTLTIFVAFIRKVNSLRYKYPEENIIIN
jgi:potassium uptake TrkH family protein